MVIIDESFFNAMIQIHDLSVKNVREQVCSDRHPNLGKEITRLLRSDEPLLDALRESNVRLGHLDEIDLNTSGTGFDGVRNTPMTVRSRGNAQAASGLIRQKKAE